MSLIEHETAVRNLAHAYSDAVSRRDPAAMAAVFAPDGVLELAESGVDIRGRDRLERAFRRLLGADRLFNAHQTTTSIVAVDGDVARARHWFTEIKQHTGEAFHRYVVGLYEDEAVLLDEGWRFRRRRASALFEAHFEPGRSTHRPGPAYLPLLPGEGTPLT